MTKAEEAQRQQPFHDLPPPYLSRPELDIPRDQTRELIAQFPPPPPPPPGPPPAPGYNIFPPAPYAPPAPYSGGSGRHDRKSMRRQAINDARAARDARLNGLGLGLGGWRSQGQLTSQQQTQHTQQTQGYVYEYTNSSRSLDLDLDSSSSSSNHDMLTTTGSNAQSNGNGMGAKVSSGVYAVVQYRADVMRARRDTRKGLLGKGILAGRSFLLEKAAGAMSRSAGTGKGKGKGKGE